MSMIDDVRKAFRSYRSMAEKALAQVSDGALNRVPHPDGNSLGMQVRHVSGNMISRFTNFLTEDGEKAWRNRDGEFEERSYSRQEMDAMWRRAWDVLDETLAGLTDSDLDRVVYIRGEALSVHEALLRSLAHLAYHVGQIILLARMEQKEAWDWISIPKGQSEAYNRAMKSRSVQPDQSS